MTWSSTRKHPGFRACLDSDGGVAPEHQLQATDVALRAVRHEDLARCNASVAIEFPGDGFPQFWPPLLCAIPADVPGHESQQIGLKWPQI